MLNRNIMWCYTFGFNLALFRDKFWRLWNWWLILQNRLYTCSDLCALTEQVLHAICHILYLGIKSADKIWCSFWFWRLHRLSRTVCKQYYASKSCYYIMWYPTQNAVPWTLCYSFKKQKMKSNKTNSWI